MAFQQGLSGLNSASRNLDVIGHNIANANTVGMKTSRAEFAELYASSVNAAGGSNKGIGVTVAPAASLGGVTQSGNAGAEPDVAAEPDEPGPAGFTTSPCALPIQRPSVWLIRGTDHQPAMTSQVPTKAKLTTTSATGIQIDVVTVRLAALE